MKDAMVAAINHAILSDKSIKIQMDVERDWNQFNLVINPDYVDSTDEYVIIHSNIGTVHIDTLDIEYDVEDMCYICDGVDSTTAVFC